jgi:hypothetical protein
MNTVKKYMGKEGRKIRKREKTQVEKRRQKENM